MGEQEDKDRAIAIATAKRMFQPAAVADNFGIIPGSGVPLGGPKDGSMPPGRPIFPQSISEIADHLSTPSNWIAGKPKGESPPGAYKKGESIEDLDAVPGDTSGTDRSAMADLEKDRLLRTPFGPAQAQQFVAPERMSYSTVGGRKIYDKTFEGDQLKQEDALREAAELEAKRDKEIAEHQANDNLKAVNTAAEMAQTRQRHQEQMAARQEKLDQATQFYSNDLANQNKFWDNPGNIFAAITFSLMPLVSNDPNIGIRTIESAIQRDLENRKTQAETTLGALKSNLHGYQKIAEDKESGDLLAQAEAYRMAAQQVQEISSRFQGPIAKSKAEAAIAALSQKASATQMEVNHRLYSAPAVMNKAVYDKYGKGPDGMRVLTGQDGEWSERAIAPLQGGAPAGGVKGQINGSPTTASTGANDGDRPSAALMKAVANADPASLNKGIWHMDATGKFDMAKQVERAILEGEYRRAMEASTKNGVLPPDWWTKWTKEALKDMSTKPELLRPVVEEASLVQMLRGKINLLAHLESRHGRDIEDFIPVMENVAPGALRTYRQFTSKSIDGVTDPYEKAEKARQQAVLNLRSDIAGVINANKHKQLGAAQSEKELQGYEDEIKLSGSIASLNNWLKKRADVLQNQVDAAYPEATPFQRLYIRKGMPVFNPADTKGVAAREPRLPNSPLNPDFIGPR